MVFSTLQLTLPQLYTIFHKKQMIIFLFAPKNSILVIVSPPLSVGIPKYQTKQ